MVPSIIRVLKSGKVLLIILDGFGEGKKYRGNAIRLAKTPTITRLKKRYPWMKLEASGEAVGTPKGTQGGSEVSHFTIGAGRIIFQSLEAINRSIRDGSFYKKSELLRAVQMVKRHHSSLHLLGMISDKGVHSYLPHLFALLRLAQKHRIHRVFIHAITDGRDVPERSAVHYLRTIEREIKKHRVGKIATLIGRYYAMDRDNNWHRIKKAYDLYTKGKGVLERNPIQAVHRAYERGIQTDYYLDPILLAPEGTIKKNDVVIFWNYRTDRARQLTQTFAARNFHHFRRKFSNKAKPLFICFGPYSEEAPVVFPQPIIKNNLGMTVAKAGLRQLRIAETEKYAHVTYFLNNQIEKPFPREDRIVIDSPKVPSYASKPKMSAYGITETLIPIIKTGRYHFIAVNFANCDLVGHSGNLRATVRAVEIIDDCLGKIIPKALEANYNVIVTGDHGNAEYMVYESSGDPCPSHTRNPVPFLFISRNRARLRKFRHAGLKDIAPTILSLLKLKKPKEMRGRSLISKHAP